ncbi:3-hydroxyacyl-[acyl-carrier-protein] dehydratase FabZ [Galdieria sulphuraria]|uniref:3-hydroxyacyl-[acyl-carrier-protein] dehydratase n=1 Tax=Galdieria sulphuraria TaxID=130081 RepID=M2XDZ7_GALSU|nr:3R-hydroxymyristoyl ACP dehydrase isoform 1 [Galdieria sulphuraria]EME28222.1 3R-hydroxymyristoyl ACP dehydrase isoform 1 [Galdieria sulphuraria]GJD11050.1 3-hydroxyacyl-[acyl-carrier-protein] dehydratase FabZ [Galdieria sulphuraria]|eukprot:XP_005704742.1 3R-hydroxymyristoyl ACP dehydrase isoform 1 [Galdieria sulphuraria]
MYIVSNSFPIKTKRLGLEPRGKSIQQQRNLEKYRNMRTPFLRSQNLEQTPSCRHRDLTFKMQLSAEELSKNHSGVTTVFGPTEILKILPHRFPFLLVDRVIEFEAGKRAVGLKNVTFNEPQFIGHFPEKPIFPGVYMLEALAQLGGIVMLQPPISDSYRDFYFAGVTQVRFRKPVVPGDTLVMQMEVLSVRQQLGIGKMSGKAYVDGKLAVEGEFTFSVQS